MEAARHDNRVYNHQLGVTFRDDGITRVLSLSDAGLPEIPVIAFTRFDRFLPSRPLHTHDDCFEIGLCLRGSLVLHNNGTLHTIRPGDMFLNKPYDTHGIQDIPVGTRIYSMLAHDPLACRKFLNMPPAIARELHDKLVEAPCRIPVKDLSIEQVFEWLFKYYDRPPGPYRTFCLITCCLSLLKAVIETPPHKKTIINSARMEQIVAEMREHPERHFRLKDLILYARISQSRFISQFKQITGLPPIHFLTVCRLEQARKLLISTDLPLSQIAVDSGFCAPQHFSVQFKRSFGMSPLVWRKSHKTATPASRSR